MNWMTVIKEEIKMDAPLKTYMESYKEYINGYKHYKSERAAHKSPNAAKRESAK